jgi:hypothetical protein
MRRRGGNTSFCCVLFSFVYHLEKGPFYFAAVSIFVHSYVVSAHLITFDCRFFVSQAIYLLAFDNVGLKDFCCGEARSEVCFGGFISVFKPKKGI